MDNTLVSARISQAKKERGTSVLASIGATTSDLINSAFDYVIAKRQLPSAATTQRAQPDARQFADFVARTTLAVEWLPEAGGDYKALEKRERLARYESLA